MAKSDAFAIALAKAAADLQALRNMQDSYAFDEGIFGFHAQQACEKLLKAWLIHLGVAPPFIHDLRRLLEILADHGVAIAETETITDLTDYAVGWRYDEMPPDELLDRPATIAVCERLHAKVLQLRL